MNSQDDTTESSNNALIELGNFLRRAREHKGLSVGEVAERLKLPARQIDAMENGCYQNLPEEVFIKGFITTYARFLELDPEEIQRYLQQIFPHHQSKHAYLADKGKVSSKDLNFCNKPVRKTIPRWVLGLIVIVVIGGVVYAWQGKSSAESAKQAATASQEVSSQASSASVIAASNVRVVPMTASDLPDDVSSSMASMPSNSVNNIMASGVTTSDTKSAQSQNDQLTVSIDHPSWLQINDKNGAVLLSKLVEKGFTQQFEQGAPYRLIIGYTPGVHVQFNGQEVPIPLTNKKTAVMTVGAQ